MAGQQRTFDLVPTTLMKTDSKPPMTSKAAKKAYLKAQSGPRISRAEQRRRDAEELQRQRKEYEKERAAERAKAAREKKLAKANAEREARKKMGLPEPSKFVRASQPTISKFVKTGSKRAWQEMEKVVEDPEESACEDQTTQSDKAQPPTKQRHLECDSEDEFGDFPSLSQSDLFDKTDSSILSVGEHTRARTPPNQTGQISDQVGNRHTITKTTSAKAPKASDQTNNQPVPSSGQHPQNAVSEKPLPHTSSRKNSQELPERSFDQEDDEFLLHDLEIIADMASTQLLSEEADAATRSDELPLVLSRRQPDVPMVVKPRPPSFKTTSKQTVNSPKSQVSAKVSPPGYLHKVRPVSARLPSIPLKNRTVNSQEGQLDKLSSPAGVVLQGHAANMPPPLSIQITRNMATRESELATSSGRRPILQERSMNVRPLAVQRAAKPISIANPHIPQVISGNADSPAITIKMDSNPLPQAPPSETQAFLQNNFDDFYPSPSQQSRELMELIDNLPSNTQIARELTPPEPNFTNSLTGLFPTQDFPGNLVEVSTPGQSPCHRGKKEFPSPQPAKARFFEEKDDDLLHAAILESGVLAAAASPKAHKTEALLTRPTSAGRTRRTLRRVVSNATDYGDDDFRGCSQELLALC